MALTDRVRKPKRWVLGVQPGPHDGSAALLCDGSLFVMAEQERFSRNKGAEWETPLAPIAYCLDFGGIRLDDLTAIGIGADVEAFLDWFELGPEDRAAFPRIDVPEVLFPRDRFEYEVLPPIRRVRHHLSHAASTFRASGYEEAAVVVIDNRGEDMSAIVARATRGGIEVLETLSVNDSLGLFYQTATAYTGLGYTTSQSGKFMGLASYGVPNQPTPLSLRDGWPVFDGLSEPQGETPDARREARKIQFLEFYKEHCFPYEEGLREEIMAYANFAASVQKALEEAIEALVVRARDLSHSNRLCLAGGVALNCTSNGRIHKLGLFEEVFVQPAAHDAGISLGAALEVDASLADPADRRSWKMEGARWGPEFARDDIEVALRERGIDARALDEDTLIDQTAELVARDAIVGWFQGRAEIGPRALGARSILGNPRYRRNLTRLNLLKGREIWRPLAPSVVEEAFFDYFEASAPLRFMLVACQVRPDQTRRLPAIVHVDGSARPHAVAHSENPRYWRLLDRIGAITGDPIVINTSFNLAGEPIVNTPGEAIHDFLTSAMDALAIGDFLLTKPTRQPDHPDDTTRLTQS